MSLLAEDVRSLLDELEIDRAVLGGISMGGYVALAFATYYPERLLGLALVDTRATADTDQARVGRTRMAGVARLQGPQAVVDEMMPKFFSKATAESRPELAARVRALGAQASIEGLEGALAAMRDREDTRPFLHRITVPSLVLVGEEDAIAPVSDSENMAAEIPGAVLRVVTDAGHLSAMEQPVLVAEALRELLQRVD
jgi:pimeloyl-ACP methyl ester carboxylesterase